MKSQSFDDWILADDPLSPEQESTLKKAIASLPLGENQTPWVRSFQQVEHVFKSAPLAAPAAGFSGRWQSHLAEKKARHQRLMIGLGALLAIASGTVIGLAIFIPQLETVSIAQLANSLISSLVILTARVYQIRLLASYIFRELPPVVPIVLWVGIATSMSLFTLAWIYTMWRIIIPKGIKA